MLSQKYFLHHGFFHLKYNKIKKSLLNSHGDHLALIDIYEKFINQKSKPNNNSEILRKWCSDNYLHYANLEKITQNIKDITKELNKIIKNSVKFNLDTDVKIEGNHLGLLLSANSNKNELSDNSKRIQYGIDNRKKVV